MTDIIINLKDKSEDKFEFDVELSDEVSQTEHVVSLSCDDYERLACSNSSEQSSKVSPEKLVEAAFKFLLVRESKEAILSKFDLMLIGKNFPEYEKEIGKLIS